MRTHCKRRGCRATPREDRNDSFCSDLCKYLDKYRARLQRAAYESEQRGADMALSDARHDAFEKVWAAVNEWRALYEFDTRDLNDDTPLLSNSSLVPHSPAV
jgi:hypothetical protein